MLNENRCPWAKDQLEISYHDNVWGVPLHNDDKLFEMLILEGMQAGLSWNLILKRQEAMREAFDQFNAQVIAQYTPEKEQILLKNPNIIRNKRKISGLRKNAIAFLDVQQEFGSFNKYIWGFVDYKPIVNHWKTAQEVPTSTEISDKMSKDLKKRGFIFVGTTICYAYMQATGMVNDHLVDCMSYSQVINKSENIK